MTAHDSWCDRTCDCSANPECEDELEQWKGYALRLGELISQAYPDNYYGMTPAQWHLWAQDKVLTLMLRADQQQPTGMSHEP